ncbi:MAG: MMPL family transporter, partial [Planctomycetota bacterium]
IFEVAETELGLGKEEVYLFGGPVYARQIDVSGANIVAKFTPFSICISLLLSWFCMQRFKLIWVMFLTAILTTTAGLVAIYFCGVQMDPLLMLLPGFWFIMAMSGSLHFLNYYIETEDQGNSVERVGATIRKAIWPSSLAVFTTCIGLFSLCTSEILPISRFGFFAALGLACGFVTMYAFLPAYLSVFPIRTATKNSSANRFWSAYGKFVCRFNRKTAFVFVLLLIGGAIGFSQLGFSNKLSDQFAHESRINQDTRWFEDNIGPVLPFEILVRFARSDLPKPSECLQYVHELQTKMAQLGVPNKTLSVTSIIPFDIGTGARQTIRRKILDRRLESVRDSLAQTKYVITEDEQEMWRLTVFAYNSSAASMSAYLGSIEQAISELNSNKPDYLKPEVSFAGLGARMAVITQKLGGGLMASCFVSVALIALVVIFALRSIKLGLVAMLPNLFPIVFSFGLFGFFSPSLDIGSIMTASIAMGIAVDDTIHFMYWFRQAMLANRSRSEAIQFAILKSGRAIASTSLICGLGFFVYFFCEFMPVARFGQLLFLMLSAALVGDLFFLPALLQALPGSIFKSNEINEGDLTDRERVPRYI